MRLVASARPLLDEPDGREILRAALGAEVSAFTYVAEGAFGTVYQATLAHRAGSVIVKAQKYPGQGERERQELTLLRQHAPVAVPQVYACLPSVEEHPEVLVLEDLSGVAGWRLGPLDDLQRQRVARAMIEVQLALHAVHPTWGFGGVSGPYAPSWWDAYTLRVQATYAAMEQHQGTADALSPLIMRVAQRALTAVLPVLRHFTPRPALIHGDYCLGNVLFDPHTLSMTGLIDPLDAGWADREVDLVHLTKSRGERFRLLETYHALSPLEEGAELRYWFYMFWTWMSYYDRLGLHDEWYTTCAEHFATVMDRLL